jgi:putative acetyltransferase
VSRVPSGDRKARRTAKPAASAPVLRAGLEQCRQIGCGAVVDPGHSGYYPPFGFSPAAPFIGCGYDVPAEAFMAIGFEPGYLRGVSGKIRCHDAFRNV